MKRIELTNLDFFNCISPRDGRLYHGHDQEWHRNWFKRLAGCGPTTAVNILLYQALAGLLPERDFDFPLGIRDSRERMNRMWSFITPSRLGGVNSTRMFCDGLKAFARSVRFDVCAEALDVRRNQVAGTEVSSVASQNDRAGAETSSGVSRNEGAEAEVSSGVSRNEEARVAVSPGVHRNEGTRVAVSPRVHQSEGTRVAVTASGNPSAAMAAEFISESLKNDRPVAFLNLDNGSEKQLDRWHWVTVVAIEFPEYRSGVAEDRKSAGEAGTAAEVRDLAGEDIRADERILIEVLDNCRFIKVNLKNWMETTSKGGGFVRFYFSLPIGEN